MSKRSKVKSQGDTRIEELVSSINTPEELEELTRQLRQKTFEAMLDGEMDDHMGYAKHALEGRHSGNNRNGYSRKTLKGEHGELDIAVPRDRNGEFAPQLISKGQTRLPIFNDKIIALYSKGMSTRDIAAKA